MFALISGLDLATRSRCFQRNGHAAVKGCAGRGRGDQKDYDYCFSTAMPLTRFKVTQGKFPLAAAGTTMRSGIKQFSDRSYTLSHVPVALSGLIYHRGPCHSKTVSILLTSRSTSTITVYVIASNGNSHVHMTGIG